MTRRVKRRKPKPRTRCGVKATALMLFAAVAAYSCAELRSPPPVAEAGYSEAQKRQMDRILEQAKLDMLFEAIEHVESGGDPDAVSAKGARGRYQLMLATVKKPGFHVKPMKNWSEREQTRFFHDYVKALLRYYHGDETLALAAYNCGVGCVDVALASPTPWLPQETLDYVVKVRAYAMLD